jgi:hypothetical protein
VARHMLTLRSMHEVLVGLSAATALASARARSTVGTACSGALALVSIRGTTPESHLDFRPLALPVVCALLGFLMTAAAASRHAAPPPARTRTR